jgi:hypothetical protein
LAVASSKLAKEIGTQGEIDFLMNDPVKKEVSSDGVVKAARGAVRAEKVRSSRYEWENKSNENENPHVESKAARGSLMATFGAWLRKLVSGGSGVFDNDDDATPSAA